MFRVDEGRKMVCVTQTEETFLEQKVSHGDTCFSLFFRSAPFEWMLKGHFLKDILVGSWTFKFKEKEKLL